MAEQAAFVTRAVVFPLDVSASEERLVASYCGARRFAYNWVIATVTDNLAVRDAEREAGVAEGELTPAVSWSAYSLNQLWNSVKEETAPWRREVSMHAFRSGIVDAGCTRAPPPWCPLVASTRRRRRVLPVGW